MSTADIADNPWETRASKPPVTTPGGLLMLALMVGFTGLFAFITIKSVASIVSPPASDGSFVEQSVKAANQQSPQ